MGERWNAVAALVDRTRRALYEYVRRQDHPVSREEAAGAVALSRNLAAFHLDKLVDVGLLTARYQAPPGQPRGRGRTPKVYQVAGGDGLAVTVPPRQYQLIAEILADAVAADPADAVAAAGQHARRRGAALGGRLRQTGQHADLVAVLDGLGFDPQRASDRITLRNCPFHALATRHTKLVCDLNHAFLSGLVEAVSPAALRADLAPGPGMCCVQLNRSAA